MLPRLLLAPFFRIARLGIFVMLAFAAGLLVERNRQADACEAASGAIQGGLCIGAKGTEQ